MLLTKKLTLANESSRQNEFDFCKYPEFMKKNVPCIPQDCTFSFLTFMSFSGKPWMGCNLYEVSSSGVSHGFNTRHPQPHANETQDEKKIK